ncbi:hypothetical protein BASA81_002665 [Batrachochytrium salamandrivorans]|nr:hypothetical protein BASA81_002665 [Batrachochytrium salamandrivorans]
MAAKLGNVSYRPPNSQVSIKCRINPDKKSLTRLDGDGQIYAGVMEFVHAVTLEFANQAGAEPAAEGEEYPEQKPTPPPNSHLQELVFDPFADEDNGDHGEHIDDHGVDLDDDDDIVFD